MKIDSTEFAALSQAQETPRVDLYAVIHKAIRALMSDTLLAVGRLDSGNTTARANVAAQVGELLDFCASHLEHENLYVHPAIEARAPGASALIAHEHEEHRRHIDVLRVALERLGAARGDADADAAAQALYRQLALFVAGNFEHMHTEETAHNAVLWARYTDAELLAIHSALVGSIPPHEMAFTLRWMLPSMTPQERSAMLADLRANAPTPAFEAGLAIARQHLDVADWDLLAHNLGLAPA